MSDHDSAIDIDSWRHSVPSRLEREDPFANDGFGERPVTRLTFREHESPEEERERPASRFSVFRARLFPPKRQRCDSDDESTIYQRPDTALSSRTKTAKKRGGGGFLTGLTGLWRRGKKRTRDEFEDEYGQGYDKDEAVVSVCRPSVVVEPVLSRPLHLNFLFVGCPSSGQTSLLYRIRYGYFPDTSVMPRTRYETYTHQPRCNSAARVELWDTSGAPDLATVQLLAHIHWDVIFLCFDISDASSLQAIVAWWKFTADGLFSKSKPLPPALRLLGTKKDLRHRSASARRFSLGYYYQQLPLSASMHTVAAASACVSTAQAAWQAKYVKAKYYECSALTGEGVDRLVEETAAEVTRAIVDKEYALYRGIKRLALGADEDC
ncbi:Ras like protein [Cordyceps militaris CM01]|uniref:Ras like protein n=1 Tax=Cordyceps militaris (strain CM01) TaxID=983644 RepID=G3JTG9_CORMM|nr:Ras like protein [Cordyceps militaris CM01]EGX87973.1 Ras like protein [Cordyceps militaris CM01]